MSRFQNNPTSMAAHDDVHYADEATVASSGHDAVHYAEQKEEAKEPVVSGTAPAADAPATATTATSTDADAPAASDKHQDATRVTVQVAA